MTRCAWCPRPADDDGPLCADCRWLTRQELAALAYDVRDLALLAPPMLGPRQRVSGTHAPSVPIDLGADALIRAIVWRLGVWEPPVREAAGLPPAPESGIRPVRLADRAAKVLSNHVGEFLGLGPIEGYPDGPEAPCVARSGLYGAASLRRLHTRSLAALDRAPAAICLPGLCGSCGAPALTQLPGTARIDCGHCGAAISRQDYQDNILLCNHLIE